MMGALQDCRLFLCDKIHMGIAPDGVTKGDVLAIIEGSVEACLLRPSPDGNQDWRLISGDCYARSFDREHLLNQLPRLDAGKHGRASWGHLSQSLGDPQEFILL
jgi:hypothetical protein